MNHSHAIEISDLVKEFPSPFRRKKIKAVDGVSIQIDEGEVYGLIGPNGSGKSTTMKALLGLLAPTSGSCRIFGKDAHKTDSRRDVGYLPENPYFYKFLTGEETLRFYGKLCSINGKVLQNRIDEVLERVGLVEAKTRKVGTYSKGMLQRLGLAQAQIHEPRLLILDEPTAGVDPVGAREIREMILNLKNEGKTVFLCSHLLEQVQEVCDRVGMIFRGKLKREGTLDELITLHNQLELTMTVESDQRRKQLIEQLSRENGIELLSSGSPRTSLERLFIELSEQEGNEK